MDAAAKQQIIERVRQANNILVTVSQNPSVDQLAACIGLTLLLNRLDKHATAVFSGKVPSTIEFLQPEKTIETNTDSLRDFIISLDKEKADKLRYKVEDEVVRIFITPYKTSLSEKDLVFSQGDFNVEVVMALGIKDRSQVDAAITAHGKILHDATVISLNAGEGNAPELGQINWQDLSASSLSEMIVSISEAFGSNLIDNQMATAFLTGIVAETNRFSNKKTTPKAMTISAQLMAAGANQQLIVSKLEPPVISIRRAAPSKPLAKTTPAGEPEAEVADATLTIDHSQKPKTRPTDSEEIFIDDQGNLITPSSPAAAPPPPPEPEEPPKQAPPKEPPKPPAAPEPPPAPPADKTPSEKPPGPHAILNPEDQAPILGSSFTSAARPEWEDPYSSISIDPLSGGQTEPGLLEHSSASSTPSADKAREAVEEAHKSVPRPPLDPLQASDSTPPETPPNEPAPSAGPAPKDASAKSAPPPFPPPLSPTSGVVIPTSSSGTVPAS